MAIFICVVGVLSVVAQTGVLTLMIKYLGPKNTIVMGLVAQVYRLKNSNFNQIKFYSTHTKHCKLTGYFCLPIIYFIVYSISYSYIIFFFI